MKTYIVTNPEGKKYTISNAENMHHAKNLCLSKDKFKFLVKDYKVKVVK